ncbi:amidohydrolase [Bernardetia sp.]|uniref:amidohydrolase n=1 Tax=Bernardetia sp. TaxID=1937974 RepID=UPI0025B86399|nr:amidohydrolase [Bernardetia sp.]
MQTQTLEKASTQIKDELEKNTSSWLELYKYLHQNPELSEQEEETSKKMGAELRKLGYEVTEKFGDYGVVGVLKNGKGKTILIRADMDALPVEEKTGLPYASTMKRTDKDGNEVSVMHACGHDMHMTVLIGVAQTMANLKNTWKGTFILVAQPAEEVGSGAKAMVEAELYKKFGTPDYALALHTNANLPHGTIGYCKNAALANVDMVNITVFGEGGHGAYPHTTKDPIVLASQMILGFQTIVSRETSPTDAAVVTVGSFHAGTKHNIISDRAELQLTLRSYTDEVRNNTLASLKRIAEGYAMAAGVEKMPVIEIDGNPTPATINDPKLTEKVANSAKKILGEDKVVEVEPVMGGEDFSRFGRTEENVPISLFWLGVVEPEKIAESEKTGKPLPSLHSPFYAPVPKPSIQTGVKVMVQSALDLFGEK